MPLVKTIENASQFRDAMRDAGRGSQFSYEGLGLIFDYLDAEGDAPTEFDAVAICCAITEAASADVRSDYNLEADQDIEEYLCDQGVLIGITSMGNYVYFNF